MMKELTGQLGIFSTKIAFAAAPKAGKSKEIFIADFDGRNIVQITNDGVPTMSPSWSPDGSKLTYTSFKKGRAQIYVFNLLTRKSYTLSRSTGNSSGADWSPDGKTVAYSMSNEGKTSIYTMRAFDGSGVQPLVQGSGLEVEPAYSPDGRMIAFASGRFGNPHIFVRDLGTGQDTRITFAGWYNSSPAWRPDGKKLIFAGYDRQIDRYDLFNVNPDGRQLERITLDQGDNENPTYSPDGRFILFQSNRREGGGKGKMPSYKLYIMTRDGAGQRPLNLPFADVTMPSWSPYLVGL
jgi:TolB protein